MANYSVSDIVEPLKDLVTVSLEDGKANDVVTVDLSGKTDIAHYMVVASGTSNKHTSSLAENLIQRIKDSDLGDVVVEGLGEGEWVLVDTGDIIVHIFKPEIRERYNLEKMWSMPAPSAVDAVHAS